MTAEPDLVTAAAAAAQPSQPSSQQQCDQPLYTPKQAAATASTEGAHVPAWCRPESQSKLRCATVLFPT
jgi:hypothetical protein